MNKPVLHFKIPVESNNGYGKLSLEPNVIAMFLKEMRNRLGEDYHIIATPFELENPTNDAKFLNFNGISYTYEQIVEKLK